MHQHHRGGGVAVWLREDRFEAADAGKGGGAGEVAVLPFDVPADAAYGGGRNLRLAAVVCRNAEGRCIQRLAVACICMQTHNDCCITWSR